MEQGIPENMQKKAFKVNEKLKNARKERMLSKAELARELNIDERNIRRWENEGILPRHRERRKLSKFYNKTLAELGLEEESQPDQLVHFERSESISPSSLTSSFDKQPEASLTNEESDSLDASDTLGERWHHEQEIEKPLAEEQIVDHSLLTDATIIDHGLTESSSPDSQSFSSSFHDRDTEEVQEEISESKDTSPSRGMNSYHKARNISTEVEQHKTSSSSLQASNLPLQEPLLESTAILRSFLKKGKKSLYVFSSILLAILMFVVFLFWWLLPSLIVWNVSLTAFFVLISGISLLLFVADSSESTSAPSVISPARRKFLTVGLSLIDIVGVVALLSLLRLRTIKKPSVDPIILRGHTKLVTSVAWSPDGMHLASSSADMTVRIWNLTLKKEIATCKGHSQLVSSIAWSPDGTRIASASWDKTIKLWDAKTSATISTLTGHKRPINTLSWTSDGKYLVSGSSPVSAKDIVNEATVRIWDVETGESVFGYNDDGKNVHAVSWSYDGTKIASGTDKARVYIHHMNEREPFLIYSKHDSQINTLAWSPSGQKRQLIATGSGDCGVSDDCPVDANDQGDTSIHVWNAQTGNDVLVPPYTGHSKTVSSLAWSPDGKYIVSASAEPYVQVWESTTGKSIFFYKGHTNNVYCVAWGPTYQIASGSADTTIQIWNPDLESI